MADHVGNLGGRLRDVRLTTGMSLREVARQLGVSPSFVSQLENGKSQPSVATLYSMAQLLNVSIDDLFAVEAPTGAHDHPEWSSPNGDAAPESHSHNGSGPVSRSELAFPVAGAPGEGGPDRISVTRPGTRSRLEMDTGVVWERLATNTGSDLDFIEIVYPPHSNSTNDGRMLQHAGSEFGYLLEGELEVTVGFEVVTLRAGEAIGFESSQPHLFRNLRSEPARGVWFVQHPRP
ncbi:helix-turn-helix domain-containing protein [Oryzobacter telluris]|uniref:helix-turn-helix domain-containing protein n=1 Tax=Oryzobacter telluris TaxID=3149179 RepID=UPI00370D5C32